MNNTPSGKIQVTEKEVTEEPITPLRNRPWKYIPQFSDEECRLLCVEKEDDNGDGEERRESSDGLLQYYRHNRALETAENDANSDLEVVEQAKIVYGKPSGQSKDQMEVQEEQIVPVRIQRRTEMEAPQQLDESLNGHGLAPFDDVWWRGGASETEVEVEQHQSMRFATPPASREYVVEVEETSLVLPTEFSPPAAFDDHIVEFPAGNEEVAGENQNLGLFQEHPVHEDETTDRALDFTATGGTFPTQDEVAIELNDAVIEPQHNSTWLSWLDEGRRGEALELSGEWGSGNGQAKEEVQENMETKFVSQTMGIPVLKYDTELGHAEGMFADGRKALVVDEKEERSLQESALSSASPFPADVATTGCKNSVDIGAEIQGQEPSRSDHPKTKLPDHQGSTLPPSSSRTLPETSPRPRRSSSESFFGFLRKKTKTKDGENGEEKKEVDDKGKGRGREDDTEDGKSENKRTTPTNTWSKEAKKDDSKTKIKAGQTQKTSFLQKLGFGRGSKTSDKHLKQGKGQQEKEGDEESKQKTQAEPKSPGSKQSTGKSNIRIFEILAKNNEGESATSPEASKSSNTSEVVKEEGSRTAAESELPAAHSALQKQAADVVISDSGASKAMEKREERAETSACIVTPAPAETQGYGVNLAPAVSCDEAVEERDAVKQATPLVKADAHAGGDAVPADDYLVIGSTQKSLVNPHTEVVSSAMSVKHKYIVAVAIDFGTAFSGYAFCFLRDPDSIHMMSRWEDGDPGVINQKTPTTLLLTPQGQFHSFGFSARNNYHDLSNEDSKEWLYFDRFKMALYQTQDCSQAMTIEAANGKRFPGLIAISMTLRFFRDHALQQISSQSETKILNDDILWIVTVPAIWNASAKQLMRMAAYEAELTTPETPDQLVVALEPEAASVHIRRLQMRHLVPEKPVIRPLSVRVDKVDPAELEILSSQFNDVVRYIVVDCGGGTVDITVHEMNSINHRLQELLVASGGPHGSFAIDRDFEVLLGEIFGREFIESYRRERPSGWIGLMMAFESRKRAADPLRTNPLNVALPFSFIEYYRKTKGSSVDEAIKAFGNKGVRWSSQGMLRLSQDVMKQLFRPTLDKIKEAIEKVLDAVRGIDYIFLVGGLSESGLLQSAVRDYFKDRVKKVVIPQEANIAVIKGAVVFGLDPSVIAVRRSKLTYGAAVLNRFIHGKHLESKLVQKEGVEWCRDVFDVFVIAGQVVRTGETVVRQYIPAAPSQKRIVIGIYSSEDTDPGYVSTPGVRKCANVSLDLTPDHGLVRGSGTLPSLTTRRRIQAELVFAETEIKVTATDTATGKQVNASIDFLNV